MVTEIIQGVFFQPLSVLNTTGGSVMHAIRGIDENFPEFGECYFSTAARHSPKAWKKHSVMICNLFVAEGNVHFVFYDDRNGKGSENGKIAEFVLGRHNYGRLTIHPGIWFGFASIAEGAESIILNLSNIQHDPGESVRLEPGSSEIPYIWKF